MQTAAHQPRNTRLEARVSSVQKALFLQAAELTGRTLSDLIVESTQEAATRIIKEHNVIRLNREEQIAFAKALLDPPPVTEKLKESAAEYRRFVEQGRK